MSQAGFAVLEDANIPGDVATQYFEDFGSAIPVAHQLNIVGGVGIHTSGSGNTITISVQDAGTNWTDEAVSFNAQIQNSYFCTGTLTATLALQPPQGSTVWVYVDTASVVTIKAQGTDKIQVGLNVSAAGGTASSNTQGAILALVYRTADATWHTISSMGTWAVVT